MVKFAFIKEVELEDPNKCGGCIFQDFAESGASMGSSYCNATEEIVYLYKRRRLMGTDDQE